jgi:uncharacterized protein (TIGR00106 family)
MRAAARTVAAVARRARRVLREVTGVMLAGPFRHVNAVMTHRAPDIDIRRKFQITVLGVAYAGRMLLSFSITPLGVGESVGKYVADAVRVVRESGLPNRTDAMFTTVEGEWDEVMAVLKAAVDAVQAQAPRVSVVMKADVRPGVTDAMTKKVADVEAFLRD